jgi:hypothetical protein
MRRVFIAQRCHTPAGRSLDKSDRRCPESTGPKLRRRLNSGANLEPVIQEREQFAGYLRAQGCA